MGGEWRRHEVSDLLKAEKLIIGDGYRAKNEELASNGLPFARAGNINNGFRFEDAAHFPEQNLSLVGNKISQPYDVVFTSKGTVGRFAFVGHETKRFVYSPQLCFWRSLDRETIDPRFLYYWMYGREFFVQFKGVAGQTDMAEYVSLTDQRRMHITLPDVGEQRVIAHILGALDDKIELNRRMNETLEATARALFKSWFVDFDPVLAKMEGGDTGLPKHIADLFPDSFEESELGEIPRGWGVKNLDEIANFLNGLALQKYPPGEGATLPVIKIAQLRKGDTEGADRCNTGLPSEYVINDGGVLFSWSGSLECVLWTGGKAALNQHLFKVTSTVFPKWFYYLWVHQHLPNFRHIAAGKATTMGHIQRHHLTDAKIVVPTPAIFEAADKAIAPIIGQVMQRRVESRALTDLRDGLLSKLISGELRVGEADQMMMRGA